MHRSFTNISDRPPCLQYFSSSCVSFCESARSLCQSSLLAIIYCTTITQAVRHGNFHYIDGQTEARHRCQRTCLQSVHIALERAAEDASARTI